MLMLGVGVLGDLNTKATSQESLGLAFWRIVLSAGILAMVMSVVNLASVCLPSTIKYTTPERERLTGYRVLSSQTVN